MSVKPARSINRYRSYAIFSFDKEKFRNGFDAVANVMCCSIILITPFEHVLENCCAGRRLTQACWRSKSILLLAWRKDSRIIDSMIHAAHNGKKVTVVVELQARHR